MKIRRPFFQISDSTRPVLCWLPVTPPLPVTYFHSESSLAILLNRLTCRLTHLLCQTQLSLVRFLTVMQTLKLLRTAVTQLSHVSGSATDTNSTHTFGQQIISLPSNGCIVSVLPAAVPVGSLLGPLTVGWASTNKKKESWPYCHKWQ